MVGISSIWASALALIGAVNCRSTTSLPIENADGAWDVIVVGAGTAGIIAAHRFSKAGKRTLLLEAGGPSYAVTGGNDKPAWLDGTTLSRVDVPGLYSSIFGIRGELICPADMVDEFAACTVGGASAINAGLYFTPPSSDWDNYHPAHWKATDMKNANDRLTKMITGTDQPSKDGKRYNQSSYDAARRWIVDGCGFKQVQVNAQADHKTKVFGYPEYSYQGGQRSGPAVTYLQEALRRNNFKMETGARVRQVVQELGVATAVAVQAGDGVTLRQLAPGGRVVLSGGALLSPALLMYSGIGDPEVLRALQAAKKLTVDPEKWVNNTAVGVGLFDNPNTFIVLEGDGVRSYRYSYTDPPEEDARLYRDSRSGPYASAGQTAVFWDSLLADEHDPGSRLVALQGTVSTSGSFDYSDNAHAMTVNVYGTSGLGSRTHVELDAAKGFVPKAAQPRVGGDPSDGRVVARWIRRLFDGLPADLKPLNIARDASVEDIEKYVTTPSSYAGGGASHWSSSCDIGKCVDVDAKVVGTENVHVVDASIVAPLTVNPQLGVMMAAEHASERILALGRHT